MKKSKQRDLKYPKATKVVTLFMVLVSVAIAGLSTYVSVGSGFLATSLATTIESTMSNNETIGMTMTNTSVKVWMLFPINNTGAVGLDINNLVVDVSFTNDENGTTVETSTLLDSIPFGESRLANITLIDTTLSQAMGLGTSSITVAIWCAMTVALPRSWGAFALKVSDLEFGFTMQMEGLPFS
ncbi:MAG: hypothetical protein JW839_11145 [Candidatus Lokiarchaeota archaeon]|nr:hypothetical protein [Candidatus Lokiarchaeota archaeon]